MIEKMYLKMSVIAHSRDMVEYINIMIEVLGQCITFTISEIIHKVNGYFFVSDRLWLKINLYVSKYLYIKSCS